MTQDTHHSDYAINAMNSCVRHAREILALQWPSVRAKKYDIAPNIEEMTIQFYLIGVMWRYSEQYDLPSEPRERGFIYLMSLLLQDGWKVEAVKRRIELLQKSSRTVEGVDNLAIVIGHEVGNREGALVAIFDQINGNPGVSGLPFRIRKRIKPIAAILGIAAAAVSSLFGITFGKALGIGVIFACAAIAISFAISRQIEKEGNVT